jgi:hypothetical protein
VELEAQILLLSSDRITEGKSPEQDGVKEALEIDGSKENKKMQGPTRLVNECDGMVPK